MKLILTALFLLNFNLFACENQNIVEKKYENTMSIWLGKKTDDSKNFLKPKCFLDNHLQSFSVTQKKIIARLITNSYEYEEYKNNDYYSL